jgi:glycosyltransferase involved in cell wall biosynthesis
VNAIHATSIFVANPWPVNARESARMPGVKYRGFALDVTEVWRQNHVAAFLGRCGEGLPRTLLEAAACARPAIVSDAANRSNFVRDGREGYVVRSNSVEAFKAAVTKLINTPGDINTFGQSARSRVVALGTTTIIDGRYEDLF